VWPQLITSGLVLAAAGGAAALAHGATRWHSDTRALRERLNAQRVRARTRYDARETDGLPLPVRRYLEATLSAGQPLIAAATLWHDGEINVSERGERWRRFESSTRFVVRRPGFDWDGCIALAPGVDLRVHDAYVAGEGFLQARLGGLIKLAELSGGRAIGEGELLRYLAEAVWVPTALLPSQGVEWEPLDGRSSRARIDDGHHRVSLDVAFGEGGLVESVHAQSRARQVDGRLVPTPWQGRFWDWGWRDGMRVPLQGEVAWLVEGVARPYWRGRLAAAVYEYD
jgi:hypothetical protein